MTRGLLAGAFWGLIAGTLVLAVSMLVLESRRTAQEEAAAVSSRPTSPVAWSTGHQGIAPPEPPGAGTDKPLRGTAPKTHDLRPRERHASATQMTTASLNSTSPQGPEAPPALQRKPVAVPPAPDRLSLDVAMPGGGSRSQLPGVGDRDPANRSDRPTGASLAAPAELPETVPRDLGVGRQIAAQTPPATEVPAVPMTDAPAIPVASPGAVSRHVAPKPPLPSTRLNAATPPGLDSALLRGPKAAENTLSGGIAPPEPAPARITAIGRASSVDVAKLLPDKPFDPTSRRVDELPAVPLFPAPPSILEAAGTLVPGSVPIAILLNDPSGVISVFPDWVGGVARPGGASSVSQDRELYALPDEAVGPVTSRDFAGVVLDGRTAIATNVPEYSDMEPGLAVVALPPVEPDLLGLLFRSGQPGGIAYKAIASGTQNLEEQLAAAVARGRKDGRVLISVDADARLLDRIDLWLKSAAGEDVRPVAVSSVLR